MSSISENDSVLEEVMIETMTKRKKTKPRVTTYWPAEDVRVLLNLIEHYPSIWDLGSIDHKKLLKRETAWKKIDKEMDCHYGVQELKAKWSNIKTAYQKVKAKLEESRSIEGNSASRPRWPYWDEMQFIHKSTLKNNTISESNSPIDIKKTRSSSIICRKSSISKRQQVKELAPSPPQSPLSSIVSEEINETNLDVLNNVSEDEWQLIGNYLASQLRYIAGKKRKTANQVHCKLIRTVIEALEEIEN